MSCDETLGEVADDSAPPSPWPSGISLNRKDRTVEMVWDGRSVRLSHKVLRRSCRCSVCESWRRRINDVLPVDAEVTLLRIEPLGATALQLFFSDGHERGIYPWAYLKQIAFGPEMAGFTESLMKGWRDE